MEEVTLDKLENADMFILKENGKYIDQTYLVSKKDHIELNRRIVLVVYAKPMKFNAETFELDNTEDIPFDDKENKGFKVTKISFGDQLQEPWKSK